MSSSVLFNGKELGVPMNRMVLENDTKNHIKIYRHEKKRVKVLNSVSQACFVVTHSSGDVQIYISGHSYNQ